MDGDNRPKRKMRKGLVKKFRDALQEEIEKDPMQHIKDSYHQSLEKEYNAEPGIKSNENDSKQNADELEEARWDEPVRRLRDTYNILLDGEFSKPTTMPVSPKKESNNNDGVDPIQRIREAYGQMFDDRERKHWEKQKDVQRPWWKKIF